MDYTRPAKPVTEPPKEPQQTKKPTQADTKRPKPIFTDYASI